MIQEQGIFNVSRPESIYVLTANQIYLLIPAFQKCRVSDKSRVFLRNKTLGQRAAISPDVVGPDWRLAALYFPVRYLEVLVPVFVREP